jgi:hypothetical protein
MAAAPPTGALDLLRFLALSLEVHTDALCCAVDDVEAAIVESSINDELMDRLEDELAGLLDRQSRLHAGQAVIALSQKERRRGSEVRHEQLEPPSQWWGDKQIQTSRTHARAASTTTDRQSLQRVGSLSPRWLDMSGSRREDTPESGSTRCLSTVEGCSLSADIASVDRQVELHKAKIEQLDCYSVRGKLLQLEKMKKTAKDIDLEVLVQNTVGTFEFPPAVRVLWTPTSSCVSTLTPSTPDGHSYASSSPSVAALHDTPLRNVGGQGRGDVNLAQHAAGRGDVVNHTNIDLLLARACQRLAGRSVDALEALASSNVSEESAAAHVLGCTVYAAEFDRAAQGELAAVMELQTMPRDALSRLYRQLERNSICTAKVDARCFGARDTVLAAQDFSALPADWTTTQSLSRVPLEEVLPPTRHLLCPRFTFANVAELKMLQTTRVDLQRKIVQFLLGGQESNEELLPQASGNEVDRTVALTRLAVAENTPATVTGHAWKTMVRVPHDA